MAAEGTLLFEDAQIRFKNFAGREGMYNAEGDRNFCLFLSPQQAEAMSRDGWNIKMLKSREEGEEPSPYIQVSLKYRGRSGPVKPPNVVMITSRGRTSLSEDECEVLDYVDIRKVDLIIRPYTWAVSGKSGVKAYLKSIYVTIEEDVLEQRYNELPEVGAAQAITTGKDDIIDGEAWEIDDAQLAINGAKGY